MKEDTFRKRLLILEMKVDNIERDREDLWRMIAELCKKNNIKEEKWKNQTYIKSFQ